MREDPELHALLPRRSRGKALREAKAQIAELRGLVGEGIARGEIRADVDRDAVLFVVGILRFAPQHVPLVDALGLVSGERTLEAIVDVLRAGLAANDTPAKRRKAARRRSQDKPS